MKIKPFAVEEWMNENEQNAVYNIAETCVDSLSLGALLDLCETDRESFLNGLCAPRLTYGDIEGSPILKKGISKLYQSIQPDEILTTHGAIGANHHVFYSLVEPGDRVVSVIPTYQQLYSIPEAFHADTKLIRLLPENGFLPDLKELRRKAIPGTKLICINNPNNPTGALMSSSILDLYDRSVVSYSISSRNDNFLVFDTFNKAIRSNPDAKPIFHSDRG
ncbi:MAG: aminotransferase class I/II-fold pyridoxal phosphate-dependent enzyme, partial [Clostridia bacterium]|nr:aminotransferase class I/II-fold pyridoxal phosphate-dependent enzyme [Clostridia bacterium]